MCFFSLKKFSHKNEKILLNYASLKSVNIINTIVNKSINSVLFNNKNKNLIKDYKNTDGQITSLDFDAEKINRITYLISEELLKNINNLEITMGQELNIKSNKYIDKLLYIPYGIIYNIPVISNLGPQIPFKIDFLGSVNPETSINIKEYGINSSLVEINLIIDLNIEVILPFNSKKEHITKKIILDSKIVQGKIPEYYGGIISNSLK